MIWQLELIILLLVIVCAVAAITVRDLLSAALLLGAYSFLLCLIWAVMGGCGCGLYRSHCGRWRQHCFLCCSGISHYKEDQRLKILGKLTILLCGVLLMVFTMEFPDWGDPKSPASTHLSPYFIQHTMEDTAVPNIVTSVLADYRGYDTMFETTVILTAGLAWFSFVAY